MTMDIRQAEPLEKRVPSRRFWPSNFTTGEAMFKAFASSCLTIVFVMFTGVTGLFNFTLQIKLLDG